jgi:hypothetical protein
MSKLKSFAKIELDILSASFSNKNDRPVIEQFRKEIIELCSKFSKSGQSGSSAPFVANALCSAIKKILLFKPICDITGLDEEWTNVSEMNGTPMWQNKRLSSLFKSENNKAYYLDAIIWDADTQGESGNNWHSFTGCVEGIFSRQYVNFPFQPKSFHINVTREKLPIDHKTEPFFENDFIDKDGNKVVEKYRYVIKDKTQLKEVWDYYINPQIFL